MTAFGTEGGLDVCMASEPEVAEAEPEPEAKSTDANEASRSLSSASVEPSVPTRSQGLLSAHASASPFVPPTQRVREGSVSSLGSGVANASAAPFVPASERDDRGEDGTEEAVDELASRLDRSVPVQNHVQVQQKPPAPLEYLLDPSDCEDSSQLDGTLPLGSLFARDSLRSQLSQMSLAEHATADSSASGFETLPQSIHRFHTLLPLEPMAQRSASEVLGLRSLVLKAISSADGRTYALRRLDPQHMPPSNDIMLQTKEACKRWKEVGRSNPHLASFRGMFVSSDLYSLPAVYFLHDYHAGAVTLRELFMGPQPDAVNEQLLWSFAVQFAVLLRAVHAAGHACRAIALAPSKVLVTTGYRLRLSSVGAVDVIARTTQAVEKGQPSLAAEDLLAVGHLLLCIACQSEGRASLDYCQHVFSEELSGLISALVHAGQNSSGASEGREVEPFEVCFADAALGCIFLLLAGIHSATQLCSLLADRGFEHLYEANCIRDVALGELRKELQNGRMLR